MADPKTWVDVALAALPVLGTLGGAGVGAWLQGLQARQNNDHARELARQAREADRAKAQDERLEQHRQQLLKAVTELLNAARSHWYTNKDALLLLKRVKSPSVNVPWREMKERVGVAEEPIFAPLNAVLLQAADPPLLAAIQAYQGAWQAYRQAYAKARREADATNSKTALPAAFTAHDAVLESIRGLERAARDLLGVRLTSGPGQVCQQPAAPPGPPESAGARSESQAHSPYPRESTD